MKRYSPRITGEGALFGANMVEDPYGEWVKYADPLQAQGYPWPDLHGQTLTPAPDAAQMEAVTCRSCGADLSVMRIAACCRNPAPDVPLDNHPAAPAPGIAEAVPTCTGVKDKDGNMLFLGDRVRYRIEGEHTKREYWNPEYEIIWKAPSFTLKHVGGGKDGGSHDFILRCGGGNGNLELIKRGPHPAAPAPGIAEALKEMMLFAKSKMDDPSRAEEMAIFINAKAALRTLEVRK